MRKSPIAPAEVDVGSVPVHIRPARADEAEFLTGLSLRSKAYWGYDAAFLARCRAVMTVKAGSIESRPHYVAELDGRVVGFYGFEPEADATATTVRLTRCPLLEAAHRSPEVVCSVHLGLVSGALEEYGADPEGSDLVPFAEPGACLLHLQARKRPGVS